MRTRVLVNTGTLKPYKVSAEIVNGVNIRANEPNYYAHNGRRLIAMVDTVTPNYRKRSRDGEILNNPLWKVSYQRDEKPSNVHGTGPGAGSCTYWEVNCKPAAGFVYDKYASPQAAVNALCDQYSSDSEIAQVKAWSNIDVSEMQAWASAGEFPETVRMIIDLLKQAIKLTIAAKRGDVKTIAKEFKKLKKFDTHADTWLMWRYGIRPLVGEITALLKILDAQPIKGKRQTYRGKLVNETIDATKMKHVNWSAGGAGWDFKISTKEYSTFRAGVMVQIENSINSGLAMLGIDNPLEAIWELIPFSFIIDWFFNVGDIIAAAVGNPSLSPVCSYVTEEITQSAIVETIGWSHNGDTTTCHKFASNAGTLIVTPGYVNTFITAKRRVPLAKRYALPTLRMNLSLAKLTDLALIARKL